MLVEHPIEPIPGGTSCNGHRNVVTASISQRLVPFSRCGSFSFPSRSGTLAEYSVNKRKMPESRGACSRQVCVGKCDLDCMDVEIKADRPKAPHLSPVLVNTASREMCFENDVLRVYRIKIAHGNKFNAPDEDGSTASFPCLVVTMCDAKLSRGNVAAGMVWWLDEGLAGSLDSNDGDREVAVAILQPK